LPFLVQPPLAICAALTMQRSLGGRPHRSDRSLAANFHDLDPKPLGGAPKDLVAAGKKIFDEGIPPAMCRRAPPATAPTAREMDRFRGWPASSPITFRAN
jgi:hypothetical protein